MLQGCVLALANKRRIAVEGIGRSIYAEITLFRTVGGG
jgi:hypothetical protein